MWLGIGGLGGPDVGGLEFVDGGRSSYLGFSALTWLLGAKGCVGCLDDRRFANSSPAWSHGSRNCSRQATTTRYSAVEAS